MDPCAASDSFDGDGRRHPRGAPDPSYGLRDPGRHPPGPFAPYARCRLGCGGRASAPCRPASQTARPPSPHRGRGRRVSPRGDSICGWVRRLSRFGWRASARRLGLRDHQGRFDPRRKPTRCSCDPASLQHARIHRTVSLDKRPQSAARISGPTAVSASRWCRRAHRHCLSPGEGASGRRIAPPTKLAGVLANASRKAKQGAGRELWDQRRLSSNRRLFRGRSSSRRSPPIPNDQSRGWTGEARRISCGPLRTGRSGSSRAIRISRCCVGRRGAVRRGGIERPPRRPPSSASRRRGDATYSGVFCGAAFLGVSAFGGFG
jgi:hypothetical protein